MYEFTKSSITILCVKQDMLILSLAINWKSKRVSILNPKNQPVELLPLCLSRAVRPQCSPAS